MGEFALKGPPLPPYLPSQRQFVSRASDVSVCSGRPGRTAPSAPRVVRAAPAAPVSDTRARKFGHACHSMARRVRGGTKITELTTRVIGVSPALSIAHVTAKR